MVNEQDIGKGIKYWKSGWHAGILRSIQSTTAVIEHPVLKKLQKAHVSDCNVLQGDEMGDTIFDNLFKVAQIKGIGKQQPGESDQDYLKKLLRAVHSVDVETWNSIPIKAQKWFNEAATAVTSARPVPICPGFTGLDAVEKIEKTVIPPKGLSAQETLKTQPSKVKPQIVNAPKRKREITGVTDALRRIVILHPEWPSRQLYDYLKLNGFPNAKIDTISVDGGNIKRVIEVAKELGFWNEKGKKDETVKKQEVPETKAG